MLSGWIDPPERSGDIMPAAVIRETPVDARLLRSLFLFEALPTQELETLEANTVLADYDAGIVFAEGDPARYFSSWSKASSRSANGLATATSRRAERLTRVSTAGPLRLSSRCTRKIHSAGAGHAAGAIGAYDGGFLRPIRARALPDGCPSVAGFDHRS
jgi:hypothetical protein